MPGGGVGVREDDDVWEGVVVLDYVCQVGHHLMALEQSWSDRVGGRRKGGRAHLVHGGCEGAGRQGRGVGVDEIGLGRDEEFGGEVGEPEHILGVRLGDDEVFFVVVELEH